MPDLIVNWNEITFVAPVLGGRLASIAQQVGEEGDLTGWLFANASPSGNPPLAGTDDDMEAFVALCQELGLVVVRVEKLHVPFTGPLYDNDATRLYLARIRNRVRTDRLPTREQLLELISR